MRHIPYGKQFIDDDDIAAVVSALKSDYLTQGPLINEFEKNFASYVGSKYAVAVSNGTAALHLAAMCLGVDDSSRVIITPNTFVASANCILYCGGKVEFVDIDERTGLIDLDKLEVLLSQKPKGYYSGVVAVDFAGLPVDLEKLYQLTEQYDMWLLEDACHAPGGYFIKTDGSKSYCGSSDFADLGIFSFHPVKHIAAGEGGMITTNNPDLYKQLLKLRTHGITKDADQLVENHGGWYYEMNELGYNYRITDFQAALGNSQLKKADENLNKRKNIAKKYDAALAKISEVKILNGGFFEGHAYHLYVILVDNRKELYGFLKSKNIYVQVHYIPVHFQPYYKSLGWKKDDLPQSQSYYNQCLSLPMYPTLTAEEQGYVISCIEEFYSS